MGIFTWLILGAVAGSIANAMDSRPSKGGIVGSIILGIVGAVVGGFLASLLLGIDVSGFNVTSLIIAVVGSLIMLWVGRQLSNRA
jgi:uncharacterized membrane protein YeaQ/YmgE (transglycosylase-associated protein family)